MVGGQEGFLAYESQSGEDIGNVVETPDLSYAHRYIQRSPTGRAWEKGEGLTLGIGRLGGKRAIIRHEDVTSKIQSHFIILKGRIIKVRQGYCPKVGNERS